MTGTTEYVHGYDATEEGRLRDQAETLEELLHAGIAFQPGSRVLEVGCGVGAQTLALARRHPGTRITAVDISAVSLAKAQRCVVDAGFLNVDFHQADASALPFEPASFDHVFVCFVLEHLRDPATVLGRLRVLLSPGGSLTVIEGDHGSPLFHPDSSSARRAIACQIALQRSAGGDACIGRRLYPLVSQAGYGELRVMPLVAYSNGSRPGWAESFTEKTFTSMIASTRDAAVKAGLIDAADFDLGIDALRQAAAPGGTFAYTFFRATATA